MVGFPPWRQVLRPADDLALGSLSGEESQLIPQTQRPFHYFWEVYFTLPEQRHSRFLAIAVGSGEPTAAFFRKSGRDKGLKPSFYSAIWRQKEACNIFEKICNYFSNKMLTNNINPGALAVEGSTWKACGSSM